MNKILSLQNVDKYFNKKINIDIRRIETNLIHEF